MIAANNPGYCDAPSHAILSCRSWVRTNAASLLHVKAEGIPAQAGPALQYPES